MVEQDIPKFDLPIDFIVDDSITGDILNSYGRFPCKIKAGLFVLCMQGTVHATINLSKYIIKQFDFITLVPNTFIQIHEVSADARLYFAGFSYSFMASVNFIKSTMNFLPVIIDNPVVSLPEQAAKLYQDAYSVFIRAYSFPNTLANKEILKSILTIFIQSVAELYKNHAAWEDLSRSRDNEIYREFIQLVMEHYTKERKVSYYAGRLGITLPHFCTSIKKAIGRTPLEVITSVVIMDAKAQLKSTDLSVKMIALALGFNNLSFFNKYFKQNVGVTPQEYRES